MTYLQNHDLVWRRLKRLCSLQGSDPGVFLLAAHLFVEAELQRAGEYVQHLSRMTACTRTRLEYERSMVRMTREQQRVLEQIKLDGNFLVKGGAEELA